MKIRSLHKNLDTGFVNLSALLRYLRQKSFVGLIRVDIGDYRAEIIFDASHRVKMREFDGRAGHFIENQDALQGLLIRASEPGGVVNVYEAVGQESIREEAEPDEILDLNGKTTVKEKLETAPEIKPTKIPKPAETLFTAPAENGKSNGNGNGNGNGFHHQIRPLTNGSGEHSGNGSHPPTQDIFPLYSHPVEIVEKKAELKEEISYLSANEWEELTAITAALLSTPDAILKTAHLGFTDAFNKAGAEISNEYPFLHPEHRIFEYSEGGVMLREQIAPNLFVSGICECLRRILNKLVSNPKFFALYKHITQQIIVLVRQRQSQFDKFGYTRQLERIIKF